MNLHRFAMRRLYVSDLRALAFLLAVVFWASGAHAQAVNPTTVSFLASADNGAVDSSGQPIVTSYSLEIYKVGASQPYAVLNLGKPTPGSDGYITVNFSRLLSAPPLPGQTLEGRVAAVGPTGTGASAWSNTFTFNNAPTAQITSPANGATFTASGSINLTASVSDGDGTISRVDFYANNNLIGSASASPYAITWSNVAAGSYALSAVATDNGGLKTESASVSVTILAATGSAAAASCTTVRPGADWTCYNGDWLPPGYPVPTSPTPSAPTPAAPASPTPAGSTAVGSSASCTSVKPGADWTCYNGDWLPPGYPIPTSPIPSVPTSAAPSGSISVGSSASCTTVKPGPDWTCYNGGWLPPGYPIPSGLVPSAPASATPAGSSSVGSSASCTTVQPGAGWTCYNGGWLPPGYPIPSGSPSTTACPGSDPFVAIGGGVCIAGGWRPKNIM